MTIELLDFEDICVVKPPHSCDASCRDICATYADIGATGRKIGELKDALAEQVKRYRGLKTKMNFLRDPIAKKLPVELATAIFEHCLPKECSGLLRNTIYGGEDHASTLFTMGAVCKTWREIIWSTPRLWSHIRIPLSRSNIQTTTSFVKEWLSRTGQVSLSVAAYYVLTVDYDEFKWTKEARPLIDAVNATSSRWEYLDLELPPKLARIFEGSPSKLRELRVLHLGRYREKLRPGSLTLNEGPKPLPTYVELRRTYFSAIDISWDHVTECNFDAMHVEDCHELLRLAPKLTQCEFSNMLGLTDSDGSWIHHDNLRVLTYNYPITDTDNASETAIEFLDQLVLPRLEALSIDLKDELLPAENLMALFDRSLCKLRRLSLGSLYLEDDLDELLRNVPSIRSLKLASHMHASFSHRDIIETLALSTRIWDAEEENFLPELQVLEFITEDPDECLLLSNLIPDILGDPDLSDSDSDSENWEDEIIPTRPLKTVVVSLLPAYYYSEGLSLPYISQPVLIRIQALRDLQYKIDINIVTETGRIDSDYVEMSMANVERDGETANTS